jgi:uncharacterized protein
MEGCNMCAKGKCSNYCTCAKIGFWLVVIGAINWGLVGLGGLVGGRNWNVVNLVLGSITWLEYVIYLVVGLAAIGMLVGCRCKKCKSCNHDKGGDAGGSPTGDTGGQSM